MTAPGPPVAFPAWDTTAMLTDHDGDAMTSAPAVPAPDAACRHFRDDLELAKLTAAGAATIKATPMLLDTLTAAPQTARLTDGCSTRPSLPTVPSAALPAGYPRS